ncbi:MAG TPA: multicopper oxidase domain-containing protein, partial [Actinomycetota bacterium]|nr:multicopper oxidase domain-containing protein [Actinomycetota bacterium]
MKRLLIALVILPIALPGAIPTAAGTPRQASPPQVCDDITDATNLFAAKLKDGRIGYGLTPDSASIPGPTLSMYEGDCLAVTLTNDAGRPVGMHAHGVGYTIASDGTPINDGCVQPGRSRTFVFEAHPPRSRESGSVEPGTAGYWHYHDHCMGGPHGTGGVNAGLFGALIVRREGDSLPDREPFVVVMGPAMTINLRAAPRTPIFRANQGETVEFVVIGHGDLFHTFHLHGHRWASNRTGIPTGID